MFNKLSACGGVCALAAALLSGCASDTSATAPTSALSGATPEDVMLFAPVNSPQRHPYPDGTSWLVSVVVWTIPYESLPRPPEEDDYGFKTSAWFLNLMKNPEEALRKHPGIRCNPAPILRLKSGETVKRGHPSILKYETAWDAAGNPTAWEETGLNWSAEVSLFQDQAGGLNCEILYAFREPKPLDSLPVLPQQPLWLTEEWGRALRTRNPARETPPLPEKMTSPLISEFGMSTHVVCWPGESMVVGGFTDKPHRQMFLPVLTVLPAPEAADTAAVVAQ